MIVFIPQSNKIGECVLIVEPVMTELDKTENFIFFSKALLKKFGLKAFDKENYYKFFRSIDFYKYLKTIKKIIYLDKENAKDKNYLKKPFNNLEILVDKALKSIENGEEINIILVPENVERCSIKTKNSRGEPIKINFEFEKGKDFAENQNFIDISISKELNSYYDNFLKYLLNGNYSMGEWIKEICFDVLNTLNNDDGNLQL